MTWLVVLKAFFGALLGPLVSLVREMQARATGKKEGRQEAKIDTLEKVIKVKEMREEIENEIAAAPDLVARATRAGLVRDPKPKTKPGA